MFGVEWVIWGCEYQCIGNDDQNKKCWYGNGDVLYNK